MGLAIQLVGGSYLLSPTQGLLNQDRLSPCSILVTGGSVVGEWENTWFGQSGVLSKRSKIQCQKREGALIMSLLETSSLPDLEVEHLQLQL